MVSPFPFRLGATSYVIPGDLAANVAYLAEYVQDIELVLFDLDDGPSNLPDGDEAEYLAQLARRYDLTYTVHLPLDLRLASDGSATHPSLLKAYKVIQCTQRLNPWAYVVHIDGRSVQQGATPQALQAWQSQSLEALRLVAGWVEAAHLLAIENLETYPPEFFTPLAQRLPGSRCVDIGHLWLDGHDPLPYLQAALPTTRVIHLHGLVNGRDHQSLAHMSVDEWQALLDLLVARDYRGVLTLEVFGQEDFSSSWASIAEYCRRQFSWP